MLSIERYGPQVTAAHIPRGMREDAVVESPLGIYDAIFVLGQQEVGGYCLVGS